MPATDLISTDTQAPERAGGVVEELSTLEIELIEVFVSAVKLLGIPKSVGEIYGLLYANPEPQPLDAIVARLRMSKGSASQGLKLLRSIGAVKSVYVPGDRRDHYHAETELKRLAAGFLQEEVQPRLDSGEMRLERLKDLVVEVPEDQREFASLRVAKLAQWQKRTRALLPLLTGMLD